MCSSDLIAVFIDNKGESQIQKSILAFWGCALCCLAPDLRLRIILVYFQNNIVRKQDGLEYNTVPNFLTVDMSVRR